MEKKILKQTEKKAYVKPSVNIIKVETEGLLGQYSGQHAPAHHETTPLVPEDE